MTLTDTAPSTLVRAPRRDAEQTARQLRRRRLVDVVIAAAVPVALIGLWQLGSTVDWLDERIYPSPTSIVADGWELALDGGLHEHILSTLRNVLTGYVLGSIIGFVIGTAMGTLRVVRVALEPMLNALYVVPKLALLPIFLTIFGFGEAPKVVLVGVTVFFFVWIETMEAMASVPEGHREAARSFDVSPWQMFRHVLLPAALPRLFVGLRIAMGVAVLVMIAAEFLVGDTGLGYLIFNSRRLFLIGQTYVGIVVVAALGVVLAGIVTWVGDRLTPWHDRQSVRAVT